MYAAVRRERWLERERTERRGGGKAQVSKRGKLLGERLSLLPGLVYTVVSVFASAVHFLTVAQTHRGMEGESSAGNMLQGDTLSSRG